MKGCTGKLSFSLQSNKKEITGKVYFKIFIHNIWERDKSELLLDCLYFYGNFLRHFECDKNKLFEPYNHATIVA